MYNVLSATDQGTLFQLRNVRNVVSDPSKDFNASDLLVVKCHILCAAMRYLQMDSLDSFPVDHDQWDFGTKEDRQCKLFSIASAIASAYFNLSICSRDTNENQDHVHEYAKEVLSLGLLYMEFRDAIKEGDGNRVMNCWKYFMLIFKKTGHRNYAIESFNTLAQCEWLLPPRQANQLQYSNVHGLPGHNISCDLYMEHLNKLMKSCIQHLGANKTGSNIQRIGKCINAIDEILTSFDELNEIANTSNHRY